jgi:hypothetical protein
LFPFLQQAKRRYLGAFLLDSRRGDFRINVKDECAGTHCFSASATFMEIGQFVAGFVQKENEAAA